MSTYWTSILAGTAAGVLLGNTAFSQTPTPAPDALPPPNAALPMYDPQQFPSERGEVQSFTLTGRGDIDGLILKDGTEIKTAPSLSTQLAFAVKPGDRVTIHGLKAAALPLMRAVSITDENTRRTVTDTDGGPGSPPPRPPRAGPPPSPPPPPPGMGPRGSASDLREVSGRVRMALHGPQGEVNGVLLDSGAQLRFPPDQADQFGSLLQPRQALVAQGMSLVSPLGTVLEVSALGATRDQLRPVGPPMGRPDPRGPRGPRGAWGAPPPPPAPPPPGPDAPAAAFSGMDAAPPPPPPPPR